MKGKKLYALLMDDIASDSMNKNMSILIFFLGGGGLLLVKYMLLVFFSFHNIDVKIYF